MSEVTKPMAHQEAVKMHAVEGYLLNELTEEQRASFEEHYFECETCAEAVMAGQAFVSGIRPVPEPNRVPWWKVPIAVPRWTLWLLSGAMAASLGLVSIQQPWGLTAPMANTILLASKLQKGEDHGQLLTTPSATIEVNLPPDSNFAFYRLRIKGGDRPTSFSEILPSPPKDHEQRLSLQVPSKLLGSGHFEMDVEGLDSKDSRQGRSVGIYYFHVLKN